MILDASAQDQIDLTSLNVLRGLFKELLSKGIVIYLADVHAPVWEFARRVERPELIPNDRVYATVDNAVHYLEEKHPDIQTSLT